jgi:hypothetical protein
VNEEAPRTAIPADIGAPDRIAFGLNFRQLATVGAVAGVGWLTYAGLGPVLPPLVWAVAAVLAAGVTAFVVLSRRDGLPLDVWLRHGAALLRLPATQVPGRPRPGRPLADTAAPVKVPATLRGPAVTVAADGTLRVDGVARRVIACGTTDVGLRTGVEQTGLVAGFGRWLNALTGPAQIVVTARRHDLTAHADAVDTGAALLPGGALREAAHDHATFLRRLDAEREPLRRQVLAVVPAGPAADAAVRGLAALGVAADPLDGPAVTAALAAAVDPYQPPLPGPRAVPGTPITVRRST